MADKHVKVKSVIPADVAEKYDQVEDGTRVTYHWTNHVYDLRTITMAEADEIYGNGGSTLALKKKAKPTTEAVK